MRDYTSESTGPRPCGCPPGAHRAYVAVLLANLIKSTDTAERQEQESTS